MGKISMGKFRFPSGPMYKYISQDAKNLITSMLEYDMNKRIEAIDVLKNNWICKNNSGTMLFNAGVM